MFSAVVAVADLAAQSLEHGDLSRTFLSPSLFSITNMSPFRFIHLVRRPINVAMSRFRLGWKSPPADQTVQTRLANAGIPARDLIQAGENRAASPAFPCCACHVNLLDIPALLGVILSTMKTTCEQQLNTQAVAEAALPEEQRLMIRCGVQ
jgi:hypothetical protein